MANTIRDYSATAASNTVVDGADISEGCSPAGINDAIRGVMADLKDVSTGAVALESPAFDSVTGNLDVNGTVTADDNIVLDGASSPAITITDTTNSATSVLKAGNVQGIVGTTSNHDFFVRSNDTDRIGVAAAGDVSLYDSTGTTAKFFWDASTQRLGLGTTSPDQTLVVKTADGGGIAIENAAGNQYRWAVNGDDSFAVVDSGTAERMRIDSSGKLLINRTTALSNGYLAINGGAAEAMSIQGGSNNYIVSWHNTSGTLIGSITGSTGSSTSYNTTSDYRLKTAVNYDWDATTRLKQLRPARFEWIADGDDAVPVDGFLAHEVQDVVPEAISGTHNEVDDEGNPVYQGIDQSKLTPLLTKALIEAVEKIEQLETRIAALENV